MHPLSLLTLCHPVFIKPWIKCFVSKHSLGQSHPRSRSETLWAIFGRMKLLRLTANPHSSTPTLLGTAFVLKVVELCCPNPEVGPAPQVSSGQGESVPKSPWAQFQASLPTFARAKCTEVVRVLSQCSPRAVSGVTGAAPAHNDSGITPNPSLSMPGVSECPSQAPFLAQRFLWILITLNTN